MTQAAATPSRMTIADILRLGQAGRPWDFLSLGALGLEQAPDQEALRFVFAANLARLGLGELAAEQLASLSPGSREHGDVRSLAVALSGLPPAAVGEGDRHTLAHRAVTALLARGIDLRARLDRWAAEQSAVEVYRTLDGNWIRRPRGERNPRRWQGLFNGAAFAANVCAQARQLDPEFKRPVVCEGADTPALLLALAEATSGSRLGYRPRLVLLQSDPAEFLSGSALADLSPLISDERTAWIIGADASERFRTYLERDIDASPPRVFVRSPWLRTRIAPDPHGLIQARHDAADTEIAALRAQIDATYAGRDRAWWAARYRDAMNGGRPLRVLVPTSRFSTVLQYVAADLAAALERRGCVARVLMEPDQFSQLSLLTPLRAVAEFEPDLIVLANYPRSAMGGSFPASVPYICWIQDAMPHLFDAEVGRSFTDLDYLAGHLFNELFEKHGYPMERVLPATLVASDGKFHPAPVAAELRRRHECEVAMVSHQSETPRAMHDRVVAEHSAAPQIAAVLGRLFPRIERAVDGAMEYPLARRLRELCEEELGAILGAQIPARTMDLVYRAYAMPLGDRMMRHQTLVWAAEICERRGWRLHLYGRGWGSHPTLAAHDRGELAHGDDLRAAYQAAAVQLHASSTTLVHQRIVECALSGGLCLSRLHADALSGPRTTVQRVLIQQAPDTVEGDWSGWAIADHPAAMALANAMGAVGASYPDGFIRLPKARIDNLARFAALRCDEHDALTLLGDLSETTFRTAAGLEAMIERAIERPRWRDSVIAMVAQRSRQRFTSGALAGRMISMVADDLRSSVDASPGCSAIAGAAA